MISSWHFCITQCSIHFTWVIGRHIMCLSIIMKKTFLEIDGFDLSPLIYVSFNHLPILCRFLIKLTWNHFHLGPDPKPDLKGDTRGYRVWLDPCQYQQDMTNTMKGGEVCMFLVCTHLWKFKSSISLMLCFESLTYLIQTFAQ